MKSTKESIGRDYGFVVKGDYAEGILPDGTHFLIDTDMMGTVSKYSFHLNWKGYPYTTKSNEKSNCIFLHWLVLGYEKRPNFIVDHINRNKTDCRRCNLRAVTNQQNTMNSKLRKNNKSGYRGAFYVKQRKYYVGKICINDKRITLHKSQNIIECAQAFNIASDLLFGEFAGYKNDVPHPSQDLIKSVMDKCLPFMAEAKIARQKINII